MRQVIRALRRYAQWRPDQREDTPFLDANAQKVDLNALAIADWIIRDYLGGSIYRRLRQREEINGAGLLHWRRTIERMNPILSTGRPIYIDTVTRATARDNHHFVSRLHRHIVEQASGTFGYLLGYARISLDHEQGDLISPLASRSQLGAIHSLHRSRDAEASALQRDQLVNVLIQKARDHIRVRDSESDRAPLKQRTAHRYDSERLPAGSQHNLASPLAQTDSVVGDEPHAVRFELRAQAANGEVSALRSSEHSTVKNRSLPSLDPHIARIASLNAKKGSLQSEASFALPATTTHIRQQSLARRETYKEDLFAKLDHLPQNWYQLNRLKLRNYEQLSTVQKAGPAQGEIFNRFFQSVKNQYQQRDAKDKSPLRTEEEERNLNRNLHLINKISFKLNKSMHKRNVSALQIFASPKLKHGANDNE